MHVQNKLNSGQAVIETLFSMGIILFLSSFLIFRFAQFTQEAALDDFLETFLICKKWKTMQPLSTCEYELQTKLNAISLKAVTSEIRDTGETYSVFFVGKNTRNDKITKSRTLITKQKK